MDREAEGQQGAGTYGNIIWSPADAAGGAGGDQDVTGRRALSKRLRASLVLLGIAAVFFALAIVLSVKGLSWANEFSGVAGFFVALAALFSPLASKMFVWLQQGSAEPAAKTPAEAAEELAFALGVEPASSFVTIPGWARW